MSVDPAKLPSVEIFYYDSPAQGPVFATKEDAKHVAQVNHALSTAQTWGEYRSLLPEGEWEERGEMYPALDEDGKPVMKDGQPVMEYLENQDDDDPFDAETVPGVGDGDYPVWLQQMMLDWMPDEVLEKYGKHYDTRISGDSVEFDSKDLDAIIAELKALDHTVTESDEALDRVPRTADQSRERLGADCVTEPSHQWTSQSSGPVNWMSSTRSSHVIMLPACTRMRAARRVSTSSFHVQPG